MKQKNTFSKLAGSVYTCATCGRQTRNTGEQALGSELCPQCWNLAGIENEISDGNATLEERRAEIVKLYDEIRRKGGDPTKGFEFDLTEATPVVASVAEPEVVEICAWCPKSKRNTRRAIRAGKKVTHGICPTCFAKVV